MQKPEMILFDYGHTLLYEPEFDFLRGEEAAFRHVAENPRGVTAAEAFALGQRLFAEAGAARKAGFEIHEFQLLRLKYEYLGLTFDVDWPELERIIWDATSSGAQMPGAADMLSRLRAMGVRTGVISNIGWSGGALEARLRRLLPEHAFEFVLASSEYALRKPHPMLFELALRKANLPAPKVWYCGDSIRADVRGAQGAGIFLVLYEGETVERNPWADQNNGLTITGEHLRIRRWTEMTALLEGMNE